MWLLSGKEKTKLGVMRELARRQTVNLVTRMGRWFESIHSHH